VRNIAAPLFFNVTGGGNVWVFSISLGGGGEKEVHRIMKIGEWKSNKGMLLKTS
jgi:hypothetical protein